MPIGACPGATCDSLPRTVSAQCDCTCTGKYLLHSNPIQRHCFHSYPFPQRQTSSYCSHHSVIKIPTGYTFAYLVHPWLAAQAWNAFRTTSTIRCDVSTFPPHTAAVRDGDRRDFFGILTINQTVRFMSIIKYDMVRTLKRNEAAGIEWYFNIQHGSHAVNDGRMNDRYGRVQISSDFAACSGEVKNSRTIFFIDVDF